MSTAKTSLSIMSMLIWAAMVSVFLYLMVRTTLFLAAQYYWYEKSVAAMLLMAEAFSLIHSIGYFININHVLKAGEPQYTEENAPALEDYPPVAIIVSSYKEPLEVVEDTVICFYNLTYPNKHIYFLDDTRYDLPGDDPTVMAEYRKKIDGMCERIGVNLFRRKWRGAKAGMINDFLNFLDGNPPEGFEFHDFEYKERSGPEKYIIIFDADMNPFPDFVEPLVSHMENNGRIAFIQTPQYYTNFEYNRVARASGLQQAVFYEYICEGKSLNDAMFCCGTNVIFSREALMDVGGFEESSVTEDFATSLKFHSRDWHSAYMNKVCAFGMGPEDLGGYFKQQFRWALGTVGLFRSIARDFFKNPKQLPAYKWWEYFLSSTHYFVGWVLFVMMICPVLYMFFDVPSFFSNPQIYFLFFVPYIVLTVSLFLFSMAQRRYAFKELAVGIVLQAVTFPVYMRASLLAILGVRGSFGITPKGGAKSLPMLALWPQLGMALLCFAGFVWGMNRLFYGQGPKTAVLVNSLWCLYHFFIVSLVLYFNTPQEEPEL